MLKRPYLVLFLSSACWADPLGTVVISTSMSTVALTGETQSAPAPRAMTDSSQEDAFVTLTRTAVSRQTLPANTETIAAEQIRQLSAHHAGEVITALTGVRINRTGTLGSKQVAGLRGASPEQTLIMVDGRPIGGVGLSGNQDLSEISVEQIDRIEIVRGGMAALYGPSATGGVINIISKRAAYEGLPISHFGTEGRSFAGQTYALDFGSRYGPVDFFFFGNRSRERGYRMNDDAKTYNLGGNVGVGMGKAGKVLFDITSYQTDGGSAGRFVPDLPPGQFDGNTERAAVTPGARQHRVSDAVRMSYLLPLPRKMLLALRLFGSQRRADYEDPDFPAARERQEQSKGAEAQLTLPLGFLVGGTFVRDRLDQRDQLMLSNNRVDAVENGGVFIQENWNYRWLTLIPAVRWDHNSQFGESTNPRLQGMVDARPWLRFSASAGRSERAPTLDDLYTPFTNWGSGFSYQGNSALRPEKTWTYDAGFGVHVSSFTLKANYFHANVSDYIQTTGDAASTSVNVDRVRRHGADVQLENVWSRRFSDRLNYTFVENRGIPAGFTEAVVLRLSPRHMIHYRARLTLWKALAWDNTLRFTSDYFEGNNQSGDKLASYFTWDTRFQYPIRQLDLYVGLNNITRKHYRERSGYPLPGRTIYGGIRLRLWG